MKKIFFLVLVLALSVYAPAQKTDSFYVVGKNMAGKTAIIWNKTNGRLACFKADDADIKNVRMGDVALVNLQTKKITSLHGAIRNYSIIQPDKAEPVGIVAALQTDGAEPVHNIIHARINYAEPVNGMVSKNVYGAEPINSIINIQVDNIDPINGIITAQNKSGKTFRFRSPAAIAKTQKIGDPVYVEPINGIAIIQVSTAGQTASYGYGIENGDSGGSGQGAKWLISPNDLKGSTGRILFDNPPGSIWTIYIYMAADEKYVTSYAQSNNKGVVVLAPGQYKITINDVPVLNVPVQKSYDTKLKCGTLAIVSEGIWYLYDETGTKAYTSGNKATKMPVPIGNYQLEINGQKQPLVIKNGEMVEM